MTSGPPLEALEPAHEAAAHRRVGVDVVTIGVGEHPANDGVGLAWLGKSGIDHHSLRIEGPQRQDPSVQRRRNLALEACRSGGGLADEDRVAGPIGVIALMRDMIDQQQGFTVGRVVKLDAAGKSGQAVSNHANGPVPGELIVTKSDEMRKLRGLQAGDPVGHSCRLATGPWPDFPQFAVKPDMAALHPT